MPSTFEEIKPNQWPQGDGVERPWLIVLSNWQTCFEDLVATVNNLLATSRAEHPSKGLATLLVFDDVCTCAVEHQALRQALIEAGALILEPAADAENGSPLSAPIDAAAEQLRVAMQAFPLVSSSPPPISEPEGYKAFAIPFTRLSPEDIEQIINRRDSHA